MRGAKNNGSGAPASFRCCGKFQPEGQVLTAGTNGLTCPNRNTLMHGNILLTAFHLKSRSNLCDVEKENINTEFPAASPLLRCPAAALLAKAQPSEHPLLAGVSS